MIETLIEEYIGNSKGDWNSFETIQTVPEKHTELEGATGNIWE
jgi:hypothetical protein